MKRPIIDLHCDLLFYLLDDDANMDNPDLGCAIPYLQEGQVKLQVMAIFAPTQEGSHQLGLRQSEIFNQLNQEEDRLYLVEKSHLKDLYQNEKVGMLASIESGAAFCDNHISLKEGFANLEQIRSNVGDLFYISLTHHTENRFGGGNYTSIGLKDDGKALLDYLDNQKIAIDFSHTSDKLAYDILDYSTKQNLKLSIIASHSNYRPIFDHPRNLPDELAQEIIHRQGLIGVNFLRAFVNHEDPEVLHNHIDYGIDLGAQEAICYGADYFYTNNHPDQSRIPFYFKEHENALCYQELNAVVEQKHGAEVCDKFSSQNALRFLERQWNALV